LIVCDASAVIDGLLDPAGREGVSRALAGLDGELAAPDLLDVEVQSVLRRWERRREIGAARARQLLADLAVLPIVRHPALAVIDEAWALRHRLTAHDAQYVALARVLPARLLTTDAAMARAAAGLGVATQRAGPRPAMVHRDGVQLGRLDFGGDGRPALLLHGLAGHAGEWKDTAAWLADRNRVVAPDARGHGSSERRPRDVSRRAHVDDVAYVIEQLDRGPVVLIGQSLGAHTAFLVAAARPDLVSALVVAEASPAAGSADTVEEVARTLARWPVPFPTRAEAVAFFGGPSVLADAWADGLDEHDGGLWPRFDVDVMAATLREAVTTSVWSEWERVRCPTLVVRAGEGTLSSDHAREMVDRLPTATLVEVPGARHDVHLDRPHEWRAALTEFLDEGT
jgi:pimeloyl-ACP methyl ester carboxylesterase/predicted nucleic acid-binding protein